jgi:hypothetical protein
MFGEPLNPISWWWYALAVSGLWAIALLWVPNQQGRRRALRWGVQLWVEGWPLAWGSAITLASMGLAVGLLYWSFQMDPLRSGLVLVLPWIVHSVAGIVWNALRSHQAYHQFRMVLVPVLLLLAVPFAWWTVAGQDPDRNLSLTILGISFAVLYLTSLARAAYIYITLGPGPLYFRIAYLCALEAIPWLWIYHWLSANAK